MVKTENFLLSLRSLITNQSLSFFSLTESGSVGRLDWKTPVLHSTCVLFQPRGSFLQILKVKWDKGKRTSCNHQLQTSFVCLSREYLGIGQIYTIRTCVPSWLDQSFSATVLALGQPMGIKLNSLMYSPHKQTYKIISLASTNPQSTKELEIFLDFWIVPLEATFFKKSSQEYLWLDFKKLGAK